MGNLTVPTLRNLLEKSAESIRATLPRHLTPERIIKVALLAANQSPKILECTQTSIIASVMQAASLGLEPGGPLQQAYLVPYKQTCTLIPGYRGMIALARRSGEIKNIEAHVVYERDKFRCAYGLQPVLEHEPHWGEDRGEIIAAYAIAHLTDGSTQTEVMTRADIDHIRCKSKAAKNGPWVTDFAEMARKTVVKRLCKYLPISVELAEAIDLDNRVETGEVFRELGTVSPGGDVPQTEHEQELPQLSKEDRLQEAIDMVRGAENALELRALAPRIKAIDDPDIRELAEAAYTDRKRELSEEVAS